jgi:hypothetical protein
MDTRKRSIHLKEKKTLIALLPKRLGRFFQREVVIFSEHLVVNAAIACQKVFLTCISLVVCILI